MTPLRTSSQATRNSRHGTLHRSGLEDAAFRAHRPHHLHRLVDVVGERLLAVDVLARAQGGQGDDGVPVVRGGDADGVDVVARQEFAEVLVGRAAVLGLPRSVGVEPAHGFLRIVAPGGVHVADRQHLGVQVEEVPEQPRGSACPCR